MQGRLIVDVDGTLTHDDPSMDYSSRRPRRDVIERENSLHGLGVRILIYSARNMRTHRGNLGLINKHTLPVLIQWLEQHCVRFDEIYMGKPWCGADGFYVRERSIQPDAFVNASVEQIGRMLLAPLSERTTDHDN